MMKRILILLACLMLSIVSAGCSNEQAEAKIEAMKKTANEIEEKKQELDRIQEVTPFEMKVIQSNSHYTLLENSVTHVLFIKYAETWGYSGGGGIVEMSDPETGLPLTYDRYMELSQAESTDDTNNLSLDENLFYKPDMKGVTKILIPKTDIYRFSDTGEAPDKFMYQIDDETTYTYKLTGEDERENYMYERVEDSAYPPEILRTHDSFEENKEVLLTSYDEYLHETEAIDGYDNPLPEDFFLDYNLYLFRETVGSGSITYSVDNVSTDTTNQTAKVYLSKEVPLIGTMDMTTYYILVPVEKTITDVKVEVTEIVEE